MVSLGHVHLKVLNVPASEAFYRDLLGMNVTDRVGNHFVFLSFGKAHHDLALQQAQAPQTRTHPYSPGLYHVAFEVPTAKDLGTLWDKLTASHIPFSPVDHGISYALYFNDPDGNGLEIYTDRRAHQAGREQWGGNSDSLTRNMLV